MAVKVPQAVADGLERVRRDGRINMLDRRGVQYIANDLDEYATVAWIEDHPTEYRRAMFEGVEAE